MEDERFNYSVIAKSMVDGKRYYVVTTAVGNFAYITAVYSANFLGHLLGLVMRRKPLCAIQSPIESTQDAILQTHSIVTAMVEMEPRSDWRARLNRITFGVGKSMPEILQDFEKWLGVDPETLSEEERERKWSEYKASH